MPDDGFDLDSFISMPRLLTMLLSPDGSRLALTVQTLAADGRRFVGAIWEVDTSGDAPPRLLAHPDGRRRGASCPTGPSSTRLRDVGQRAATASPPTVVIPTLPAPTCSISFPDPAEKLSRCWPRVPASDRW